MTIALLIFVVLSIILSIALIKLHNKHIEINVLNEEIESQNIESEEIKNKLSQEISNKREELEKVKSTIESQNNIVKSLTETAETLRQNAEDRAEEVYQARMSALELQYQKKSEGLKKQLEVLFNSISNKVAEEEEKLSTLEAKQLAYIKAQQRQEEMERKKDFYRLEIEDSDKNDIALLREMQSRFTKKEAIDKLIWEVYFKKPYDILMSHLAFDAKNKICGIYKITSLISGKVYIGQSTDVRERMRTHIKTALSSNQATNKLYQAMKKDGVENFTFELLEQISRDKLNEREKYWIEFYRSNEMGLNGTLGGS